MITHLLDSDWIIDYFNDKNEARQTLTPLIRDAQLATSIIVLAEIQEGMLGDPRRDERQPVLDRLLRAVPVFGIDEPTALLFAELRFGLRRDGQLVGDHDIWIAATALRRDLVLISRDAHFDRFGGLKRLV